MPRIWRHGPCPPRPQGGGINLQRPWGWLFGAGARPCAVVVGRGQRSWPQMAAMDAHGRDLTALTWPMVWAAVFRTFGRP